MGRFVMKVTVPDLHGTVTRLGADERGEVQRVVTEEVLRRLPGHMPRRSGRLEGSLEQTGPTQLRVKTPYARFLFFGLTKKGAPVSYANGGPHWDRALAAAEGPAIAAAAQRAAGKAVKHGR